MIGANARAAIYRMDPYADDEVGGAMITGSAIYTEVPCRAEQVPAPLLALAQGIETVQLFQYSLAPYNIDVRERDEIEITYPPNHPLLNQRMKIVSRGTSSISTPRGHLEVTAQRVVQSRRVQ